MERENGAGGTAHMEEDLTKHLGELGAQVLLTGLGLLIQSSFAKVHKFPTADNTLNFVVGGCPYTTGSLLP